MKSKAEKLESVNQKIAETEYILRCLQMEKEKLETTSIKTYPWYLENGINRFFQLVETGSSTVTISRINENTIVDKYDFHNRFRQADATEVANHLRFLEKSGRFYHKDSDEVNSVPASDYSQVENAPEEPIKMDHDFYMVTVRGLHGAKTRHTSYDVAEKEAIRLSGKENHPAYILGVVATVNPVVTFDVVKKLL